MIWSYVSEWLEVLGGSRPTPNSWNRRGAAVARASWWILLIVVAWAFAGRDTKFVYIDF
jgi:hypothetical protein